MSMTVLITLLEEAGVSYCSMLEVSHNAESVLVRSLQDARGNIDLLGF